VSPRSLGEPEDEAFVRSAIRCLRAPEHEPSFWDRLAGQLDAAEDARRIASVFGPTGSLEEIPPPRARPRDRARPAHRAADHPPREVPLRAGPPPEPPLAAPPEVAPDPAPAPAPAPAPTARPAAPARQVHVPAVPAAATARASVPRVDPLAGLKVRHDPATLPASMRRASNVVLLTVGLAAVLIAVIAGLSHLRSRSDSGAPATPSAPSAAPAIEGGDLTGGPVQTR
jgi:hypothetical protein